MKNISQFLEILIIVSFFVSCENISNTEQSSTSDTAYIDYDMTNYFARNCCGVTGSDVSILYCYPMEEPYGSLAIPFWAL